MRIEALQEVPGSRGQGPLLCGDVCFGACIECLLVRAVRQMWVAGADGKVDSFADALPQQLVLWPAAALPAQQVCALLQPTGWDRGLVLLLGRPVVPEAARGRHQAVMLWHVLCHSGHVLSSAGLSSSGRQPHCMLWHCLCRPGRGPIPCLGQAGSAAVFVLLCGWQQCAPAGLATAWQPCCCPAAIPGLSDCVTEGLAAL
jgi:hypothetical protein